MEGVVVDPKELCPICLHPRHEHLRLGCQEKVGNGPKKLECICRGPVETRPRRPVQ